MDFFINRPIFASVIALITLIAGSISLLFLPTARFPVVVPPQIEVNASYVGASADITSKSVTTPIEEEINGVKGMLYMSSNSTNLGQAALRVTFEIGYDQDIAAVDVQNKIAIAESRLPDIVRQSGINIDKASPNFLLVINLISPNGTRDGAFLSNYGDIQIANAIKRLPGVGRVVQFGLRKYAIRIWLDPKKLNNLGLTANDVVAAVQSQNRQVAAGGIGRAPVPKGQTFEYQVNTLGRLTDVEQFEDIIVRAGENGSLVRMRDVARVELGAEDYNTIAEFNGQPAAAIGVFQRSDANALDLAEQIRGTVERISQRFPDDMEYRIAYDTTKFVEESIDEVVITFIEAILLVGLVVFVFLQSWRTTLIPFMTIPVSIVGTFAIMAALGFSLNILTLLGLVLAIGIVVDDAIIVVENVERKLERSNVIDVRTATRLAMAEVRGPIIGTTLVLMAVFVPAAFLPGMTGLLYNQFALTVAIAVLLSSVNALSLTPALCALLLGRRRQGKRFLLFRAFNWGFSRFNNGYAGGVRILSKVWPLTLTLFVGLVGLTYHLLQQTPSGFVPDEDQGYFVITVQAPSGASVERTHAAMRQAQDILLGMEGVSDVVSFTGFNLLNNTNQPNAGVAFVVLDPWAERQQPDLHALALVQKAQGAFFQQIRSALIFAFNAPAIPGLGNVSGFELQLQDLDATGIRNLAAVAGRVIEAANARPELAGVFTTFGLDTPQLYLDLDRDKIMALGIAMEDVFDTLQIQLGSLYVNDINKFDKVYRVYVQADGELRNEEADLNQLRVRNREGEMIPLNVLGTLSPMVGPYTVPHYNLFTAIPINGAAAPGYSSDQAIAAMTEVLQESLPREVGYEWTGLTFQQLEAGNVSSYVFALSFVFVFLVLAALYESWVLALIILLSVPLGVLGAVLFLQGRGLTLDVFGQIGLLLMIGLVAKNAILIVEFAKDRREEGASVIDAAVEAARLRLRPILMTSFAFILGVLPLALATGAGAASRQSIGTTVAGGLLIATALVIVVPVFYYILQRLRERFGVAAAGDKTGAPGDPVPQPMGSGDD